MASSSSSSSSSSSGESIALIRLDVDKAKNPLNSLGRKMRWYLMKSLREAQYNPAVRAIVVTGGNDDSAVFTAGADIKEFAMSDFLNSSPEARHSAEARKERAANAAVPSLLELFVEMEESPKPIVSAINGLCLGGGMEMSLACHYRVASDRASMGLPEVHIGIVPGAGGTQRLPRLVGLPLALDVITSGRRVGAAEALRAGLVDAVVKVSDADNRSNNNMNNKNKLLIQEAQRWALWAADLPQARRTCDLTVPLPPGVITTLSGERQKVLSEVCTDFCSKSKLPSRAMGGEAVQSAVDCIRASFDPSLSFADGLEVESRGFWKLLLDCPQGRARRHVFFAERAAQRSAAPSSSELSIVDRGLQSGSLRGPIGVVGAGTMGSGIAISFLRAGLGPVHLVDTFPESLKRGVALIHRVLEGDAQKKGKPFVPPPLHPSTRLSDMKNCIVLVEAVFESLPIKRDIFRQLDSIVQSPDALFLSNTSTLSIDAITQDIAEHRKPHVAGMHFFSPAHVMKLVEIVVGRQTTSPATLSTVRFLTKRLAKVGVTVGNCEGFVGNRMLFPYASEAVFLVVETAALYGIPAADVIVAVDRALTHYLGVALGPFQMSDLAGTDISYLIRKGKGLVRDEKTGRPGPGRPPELRYTDVPDDLVVQLGRVGQKKLKGWYDYDPKVKKGRKPLPSAEVSDFIASHPETRALAASSSSSSQGKKEWNMTPQEIVARIIFPMVNEAFKILEEGYARHPSDADVIYLYGYGWPAWRGGPMFWAEKEIGLPTVLQTLERYAALYPGSPYFRPSALLRRCVEMGVGIQEFYDKGLAQKENEAQSKL